MEGEVQAPEPPTRPELSTKLSAEQRNPSPLAPCVCLVQQSPQTSPGRISKPCQQEAKWPGTR